MDFVRGWPAKPEGGLLTGGAPKAVSDWLFKPGGFRTRLDDLWSITIQ